MTEMLKLVPSAICEAIKNAVESEEPDGLAFPGACVLVLCGKGGMNSTWGWDGRAWCPNPAPQGHRPQGKRSVQAECRSVRPGAGVG